MNQNFMNTSINEAEIQQTWAPIIESSTGITDKNKVKWMSKYGHFHSLYENQHNYVHLQPNMNVYGMGEPRFPGNPGLSTQFPSQTKGSGDKPFSLLPLAMQVAAQTIALDLVPVVPMPGPMGILTYMDFIYGGGRMGDLGLDSKEVPLLIKVPLTFVTGATTTALVPNTDYFVKTGTTATDNLFKFTYVGESRIDGYPIFKVTTVDATGVDMPLGAVASTTIAQAVALGALHDVAAASTVVATFLGAAELVKALEDHITSFSGRGLRLGAANELEPYTRGEGESQPDNLMGLTLFNKSVEAQTYQVAAAVTREQIMDLKQFGIDAVAQIDSVLTNELTQSINKHILQRLFRLGVTNHAQISVIEKTNFNLVFNTTGFPQTVVLGEDATGTVKTINSNAAINTSSLTGGETQGSLQRRILSKILAAANMISVRGRRGAADFAVTNGLVATALQDISGFTPYPLSNTINQSAGSLYPVGSVAGVTVYVDPNMQWSDTRVLVGRKGDGNSPGLVFMPYILADKAETIAEGTMAPKIAVKSRYALVDAGQHPHLNYITFKIELNGYNIA